MEKPLQTLHRSLLKNNYDVPEDYNLFEQTLTAKGNEGYQNRLTLWKSLKANNYDVPEDYESFSATLFAPAQKSAPAAKTQGTVAPTWQEQMQQDIDDTQKTLGENRRTINRIGNLQQRVGLDVPKTIRFGENRKVTKGPQRLNSKTGKLENTYITPSGNEYESRELADMEQNAIDQAEWDEQHPEQALESRIDNQIADLQQQRDDAYAAALEKARSENTPQSGVGKFLHNIFTPSNDKGISPRDVNMDIARQDKNVVALDVALRDLQEAKTMLQRNRELSKSSDFLGGVGVPFTKDWLNNWKNFGYGVWDALGDVTLNAAGINDMEKAGAYLRIKAKMENGEELTDSETGVALAGMSLAQAQQLADLPTGYTAGKTTAEMVPFMAQMASNPASGLGKAFARKAVRQFGRDGLKAVVARVGARALGNIGEAAVLSNTLQAGKTAADIAQRYAGKQFAEDEDGNIVMGHYENVNGEDVFVEGGEDLATAIYKGEASSIIENFTELGAGGSISGMLSKAAGSKLGKKLGLGYISDLVSKIGSTPFAKATKRFMERTHWDGMIEEPLEEEYGIILNSILTGDNKISDLWDSKQQADIFAGTMWFGGFMAGMNTAVYPFYRHQIKKELNLADLNGHLAFGDEWDVLKSGIDQMEDKDVVDYLYSIKDNSAFTNEQRAALFSYAARLKQYQGANVADMLNKMEGGLSEDASFIKNSYETGAEAETPDEKKQIADEAQAAEASLPEYGEEFAKMVALSENPVETMDYLLNNRDTYTDDQIAAAADYFSKKAKSDGMMDGVLDGIDLQVEEANASIRGNMHQQSGNLIMAKSGDQDYYIIGGDVVMGEDGTIEVAGTGGAVIVKDPDTGEVSVKSREELAPYYIQNAEELMQANETVLRQQLMQQAEDDIAYGSPAQEVFDIEDEVVLRDRGGNEIQGTIAMLPNSADGAYVVYTPDNKALQFTADELNRMVVAHNGQQVERTSMPMPAEATLGENSGENGERTGENEVTPGENGERIGENEATPGENKATPEENGERTGENSSAISRIPVVKDEYDNPILKKGRPQYEWHKASLEDATDALIETTGGDMLMARDTATDLINVAQQKLQQIRKQKIKGDDPFEIAESRKAKQQAEQEQQEIIKRWQDVGTTIRRRMDAEAAEKRAAEEAAKSAEQKAREAEAARQQKEQQDKIAADRRRKKIEEEIANWNKPYAPLSKARNEMAGDPQAVEVLNDVEPRSLEEWVSSLIRPQSMMWDDETDPATGRTIVGLQSELGLQKKDVERIGGLVASRQRGGKPFGQVVHDIWEELPEGIKNMYDDQDVRNTLIGLFGEGNTMRMRHLTEEHRIEEAREIMRENQRRDAEAEMDAWAEAYHLTPEERETFEDFMEETLKVAAEQQPSEPYLGNDEQQNQGSSTMDSQHPERTAGRESEGGESQVQKQGAQVEGVRNSEQQSAEREEDAGGGSAVPDNNVLGGILKEPFVDEERATALRQAMQKAYATGDAAAIQQAVNDIQVYIEAGGDFEGGYRDEVWDYEGNNPELMTDQYITHAMLNTYLEDDEDQEYIATGLRADMRMRDKDAEEEQQYAARYEMSGDVEESETNNGTEYRETLTIDGKYVAEKVDSPDEKGYYNGSSYEYDGQQFGGLRELIEYIDQQKAQLGATSSAEEIAEEEAKVDTNPSEGQKEAGNYQMGHIKVDGYDISIENPKGSVRRGTDQNGQQWEQEMHNTYGYIRGTEGVDGDHIDVFLSDLPIGGDVFVVDQVNPKTGEFDEHKVMYGFPDMASAEAAYLSNYEEGWQGLGAITPVSREEFKKWVESSHRKTKPFAAYKSVKTQGDVQVGESKPAAEAAETETKKQEKKPKEHKRIVSDDQMEELRKKLIEKFNTLNAGIDVERMLLGAMYAVGKIERGVTKFADYAREMVDEIGDAIRPYLKAFYEAVRNMPEAAEYRELMDSQEYVNAFDIDNFDKKTAPTVTEKAAQVVRQQKAKQAVKKIEKEVTAKIGNGVTQLDLFGEPAGNTEGTVSEKTSLESKGTAEKTNEPMFKDGTVLLREGAYNKIVGSIIKDGERIYEFAFYKDADAFTNNKPATTFTVSEKDLEMEIATHAYKPNIDKSDYRTYMTQEARTYFAYDPRFQNYVHKELAFIQAAVWDEVLIPADELKKEPAIIEAEGKMRKGKLELSDEQIKGYAERLFDAEHGSAVYDGKKLTGYTGEVRAEKKAFIVVGRPAAGKSSVFADPTSHQYAARIIDSDTVKPWLEGYDNGYGANYVHEASTIVAELALDMAIEKGENVVVPRIGGLSVVERAIEMRKKGYDVELLFNDVSKEDSVMRAASRFALKGRYLSLDYLTTIGDKVSIIFSNFVDANIGDYERIKNEVQKLLRRSERLSGETARTREGLRQLRTDVARGERASDTDVQNMVGDGGLSAPERQLVVNDGSPIFTHAEWKDNVVPFGTQPKTLWNSNDISFEDFLNNGTEREIPGESSPSGEGERQVSGGTDGAGTELGAEQNRSERSGSGRAVENQPAKPKQELHKNKRNNVGERGKDYAPTSPKARFNANIEAVKMMRALMDDGVEAPTKDQMEVLRQYSGWGGLGTYFNDESSAENKLLRDVLTDEEYNDAVMSANSAYYTPAMVIDTLWDIAKAMGFKGGNTLEGSAGIGNIIGQMPREMSRRSDIEAVEIDSISGNILKLLYPDAKVHIQGFEDTQIPNGSVDLAITNVPFVTGLHVFDKVDKDLSRRFVNIHDFCIAKNIRKLKPGGIGIFITSSGTMDKSNDLRSWITSEGQSDVVGAFRMNNETFGGTKVTSDIIVVRKRTAGKSAGAIDVSKASPLRVGTYTDKYGDDKQTTMVINDYFKEHPEMMAGEMAFGYEKGDTFRPGSYALYPVSGKEQEKMLQEFVKTMEQVGAMQSQQQKQATKEAKPVVENQLTAEKEGRMLVDENGRLCVSQRGVAVPLGLNDQKVKGYSKAECFKDYQAVQQAVDDVLQQQLNDPDDAKLEPKLKALNAAYDKFTKRYGTLHKNTAISFLRNDIDFPSFQALENYKESKDIKGKVTVHTSKAPVMQQRVLGFKTEPKPKSVKDALIASIFRSNGIDLGWITDRLNDGNVPKEGGQAGEWTADDVRKGILVSRLGFENPKTGQLEVRHQYLSGNVREKLAQAESYNEGGKYNANIEELKKVVPMDIPAHLIDFSLGSSWIPKELYVEFVKDSTDLRNVQLTHLAGSWNLEVGTWFREEKNRAGGVYSEEFNTTIYAHQLIDSALNNRPYKVAKVEKTFEGSTRTIVDQKATQACNVRIDEIKSEFKEWMRKKMQNDEELAGRIEKIYNDKFNALVPMTIGDEFLPEVFEGANMNISLYGHQKRGVMRGVTSPTMLAHEVGTGKSFTLISTAMEMRRLGTAQKPMIVVQNATVAQMTADAKLLYPNAKILSLSEKDRSAEGRRAFYAKIKFNDWDIIIVPQSTFERIPDSPERELQFIQEKIDEKKHIIEAAEGSNLDKRSIEKLKRELAGLEQEYGDKFLNSDPANDGAGPKRKKKDAKREAASLDKAETRAKEQLDRAVDDVQFFDDLGVDALLVDEAHEYKHLGFQTSIGRGIKGIDPSYSKKCAGLYNKTRCVFEKAGWKNVVFATGTPISNTAAEIWTFMKYLMPADVMRDNDIYYFDDFVHNFGSISQMLEFSTSGKFKENTRFAAYVNKPELIRIWSQVADTVLTKEVGKVQEKIPELEGGKDQDVFLPQSPSLVRIMAAVRKELERFEQMSGQQKKENSSIPLTMYGIAKRAAIDPRLVDAEAPDEPMSKTNSAVKEILADLDKTKSYKGTVAVFCDNQNRLGADKSVEFNIFDEMKAKLVKQGVPESEIAVIKSGMSITAKQKIFDAVNAGSIRVIMGSTQTLGTGVNIQERLHLLIHMDAPDRPMDYTQRNGRIKRQGNLHKEWGKSIKVVRFGVEDSLDVTAYQRLKTKSGFIDSIMDGKGSLMNNQVDRTVEEEEEGLFDNPVAVLSGSQYALKKNQAERELRKYQGKKSQWEADQVYIVDKLKRNEKAVNEYQNLYIPNEEKLLNHIRSLFPDGKAKRITIEGATVDLTASDADKKLAEVIKEKVNDPVNAIVKRNRENAIYNDEYLKFNVKVDNANITFSIGVVRESKWENGAMHTVIHRETSYKSEDLKMQRSADVRSFKDGIEEILTSRITGQRSEDAIARMKEEVERLKAESEQMQGRVGQPFQFGKELEEAEKRVEEYTALMKKEMEEKEAKYAEQAKEAGEDGGFDLRKADDSEDDELYRQAETFAEGELFPIHTNLVWDGHVLKRDRTYSVDLMPDEYATEQQLLDGLRRQYPEYYVSIVDGNVRFESWESVMQVPAVETSGTMTKRAEAGKKSYIERKTRNAIAAVTSLAEAMHLDVEVKTDLDGLVGKQRRAKGIFNRQTGKITLVLPNHRNQSDLINTLLHEGVAHAGLRKMFGANFDTFLDNVYENVSPEIRDRIKASMKRNGWGRHEATEEYLARLAERTDFDHASSQGWWQKIKDFFIEMLTRAGLRMSEPITDDELRYILWRSYDNLLHPGRRSIFDKAKDVQMQSRLKVGAYADDVRLMPTGLAAEPQALVVGLDPLYRKFREIKSKYPDALILFKMQDGNYKAIGEDVSPVGSAFGRGAWGNNSDTEYNIPADKLDIILPRLVRNGYRIAIVDEQQDNVANDVLLNSTDYASDEINAIVDKAKADGTYMLAPNGKPSNLNELQWAQVRTQAFKDWFGDWEKAAQEVRIVPAEKEHGFTNFADARHWAKQNIVRTYSDEETGGKGKIQISGKAVEKFMSEDAVTKSDSKDVHMSVLKVLPSVIHDGMVGESHPDYKKVNGVRSVENGINEGVTIHRVFGAVDIDGQIYRVKITLKEDRTQATKTKAYSYEATKIELLDGLSAAPVGTPRNSNSSITAAKLLKDIDKSHKKGEKLLDYSKVVDENGEPKVMYHGTDLDNVNRGEAFWTFYEDQHFGTKGQAIHRVRFDKSESGKKIYEVFLNIRNPQRRSDADENELDEKDMTMSEYWQQSVERSKGKGYDGIVYLNQYEDPDHPADSWIAFKPNQIKSATDNVGTFMTEDNDIRYSLRTKEPPKKTGKGYKVFVLKDGQLYPPMVANPGGEGTPIGVWLDADAAPVAGTSKTGRPQVKAGGKGTQGGSGQLAYRPGWHLGTIPYALQFNRKDNTGQTSGREGERSLFPNNFVWAEVEYADDVDYQDEARQEGVNANGKYQHSLAGLKHVPEDGSYKYRTNPDPKTDEWVITGAMRVNRILSREEVDELVRKAGREPQKIQDGDILTQDIVDELNAEIKAMKEADEMGLLYSDPDAWLDDVARDTYEAAVAKDSLKWQEAWQDSMVSLKAIQDAIAKETGNVAKGAEDAYRFENRMHGRSKNRTEQYDWRYYRPMLKAFNDFIKAKDMTFEAGQEYLIAKHGLERNVYYAMRDAVKEKLVKEVADERKKLEKKYKEKQIAEKSYKEQLNLLAKKEQTGVDDRIKQIRETLAYQRAKEDYENGDIGYTEYLRRIESVIKSHVGGYDTYAHDYSGLTETFAKEWYDDAQDTKRQAQRAIDPKTRAMLWKEYDRQMKEAYEVARGYAEDAVFSAETTPSGEAEATVAKLWKAINAATEATLKDSYESGLMSRDTYNKVRDMFEYYVPLRGWEEDKASDVYEYMGKDNVFSPAVKKTWGRTSKAENPLAYIGNVAVSTIISGHRNLMKQHFLNYVMNNPTSLVSISESWYENIGSLEEPIWIYRSADTAGKSPDEVTQIVNDFNEEMAEKQREGYAMPVRGRLRLDVNATKGQKSEHVVEVQRAGRTYELYINGNPKAAQALNGSTARAVSRISDTYFGRKLTSLNRNMAMFFTSKNPAFVISNLSRDLNMAGASVAINEGAKYNAKFIANVAKVLSPRMAVGDVSKMGLKGLVGKGRGVTGLMPKLMQKWKDGKLNESNETERLFKEFMDEGGETGFVNMLSIDSFKEKMKKEIGQMNGSSLLGKSKGQVKEAAATKGLRLLGDTFEFYNRCAEDATRFIVYMTSRQMGKTLEESIADAKDVTLNFNRKGTGDKGNAEIRDLFIFVNPAIQALSNMYRMAKGHPLKFTGVTLGFVAFGVMMPILNSWLLNMFGGDDDKDSYWNLPPWVRKNNLVFWVPGTSNFVTIPLAQEFRVFYGVGEMIASYCLDHPHNNGVLEIVESVADLVPINPTGNGGNIVVDFTPTGAQPIMQLAFNTDFTGKPIWKDNQGNKFDPMYSKAYVSTPKWMVAVSDAVNNVTGGDEDSRGWLERTTAGAYLNNPAVWNHLLQGYFGGMYNTIAKTFDVATTAAQGDVPKVYQTPILNRFVNRPLERDNAGVLGEDYWKLVESTEEMQHNIRKKRQRAADGDEAARQELERLLQSTDGKRAEVVSYYKGIIDVLRKGEKNVSDAGDKRMFKESITNWKEQMLEEIQAIEDGRDPMEVIMEQFDKSRNAAERKKLQNRINRMMTEQKSKGVSADVEKAMQFVEADDADSQSVGSDRYIELATAQNIKDDARIKAAKSKIKVYSDKYKSLQEEGKTEEAAAYRQQYAKYFAAETTVNRLSRAVSGNKKLLGKGHDEAVMKLIGSQRNAMLKAIEAIDK
jgi:N12 class adenine-specific DNA methylase